MEKRKAEKNGRRAFAFLLAALLWAEGTFGSVCAAQEIMPENPAVSVPAEEEQTPIEEENPESGEAEKPAEGEETAPEETEKPAEGEEPAPGETEESAEGEEAAPEETEEPAEGEEPVPEETEEPAKESVSENTSDAEEELLPEQIPGAGEALGEPPVSTEDRGAYGLFSYNQNIMLTSDGTATLQRPGTADIIAYYKAHPWKLDVSNTYSANPSTKSPYKAGHLSGKSLENALNLLNFIRYVAGIPADVTLSEEYNELAQAGMLVNCVNNTLSHTPAKPSGFPDELYQMGKKGCSSSNIAWNYGNIAQSLLNGWMYDGDSSNISRMGHRRWVLNPSMQQTGFGAVGAYSAMYAVDRNGSSITDYVAWPARNMPIELMNGSGTPWTLSLGSDYKTAVQGDVTVTLKDVSSAKTWTFSVRKADGYFKVDTGGYGMPNCIIFRPNGVSYNKNSQFQVTVTGLKDKDGNAAIISYDVDFFSLSDTPKEVERVTMSTESLHLLLDDTEGKNQGALHAALTPSNVTDKTVKWKSLKTEVATVDEANGVVTAVGVGETTITATSVNGKQDACTVKVSQYSLSGNDIEYNENTKIYSLNFDLQGEGKKLAVKDGGNPTTDEVQWTSENPNVAEVDADGVITPVGVGEATIWANVENGLQILSCEVKVENAELPKMELRDEAIELSVWKDDQGNMTGESRQLCIYLSPADTKWKRVIWTSSDDSVAMVSGNGLRADVTANGPGEAEITAALADESGVAATGDGETAKKCKVTVREAVVPASIPSLIALTNLQTSLEEVKLPAGWNWKYPETTLAPFQGTRSKTFPAVYRPAGETGGGQTEALLPVYFLTVESVSLSVRHQDEKGAEQEVSALKDGWTAKCYVNYSFAEELAQYEESHGDLKNNTYYQNQKNELLEKLKDITLTSSKPQTLSVGEKSADGSVALTAASPGDTVLRAQLKLGKKTFTASRKLTVVQKESVSDSFVVSEIEPFEKSVAGDYQYEAELSKFDTEKANQVNSEFTLHMTGVTKLTAKSSNSKVVAVKSSTLKPSVSAGSDFSLSLIIKAAGTAEITVTGNDAAKTSHTLTLVVADACPGLSEETVTVNTWRTVGTEFFLYPAKKASGEVYKITSVTLANDEKYGSHSGKFNLTDANTSGDGLRNCSIAAKADTKTGTYKMKLHVTTESASYDLPFTVKVVATKPKCSVKQKNKLNLFYRDTSSLLIFDTEETVQKVSLTGCNYILEEGTGEEAGAYCLRPNTGATLNSVKKGNLKITLEGWRELTVPFTVAVEKKAFKITPATGTVTLYPKSGFTSARIGIKAPETLPWNHLTIAGISAKAKGNYEAKLQQEEQDILLQGKNLYQADSFRVTIQLKSENWTESVNLACNVKVNMGEPAIALEKKTLQLNANDAYKGYDAVSTLVRWKNGGDISADTASGVRVSVYCNAKDTKAKELVKNSQVIFSVEKGNGCYQVKARLNNKAVEKGNYQYVVQAAKDGKIWKTALTLKIVNTAPDKAVKISAKGSIDVLNREGSFMTLTPSLKAVNGSFVTAADENAAGGRAVKLIGRDAHLFRAVWSDDGSTIELRAEEYVTLVTKYQYTVTPMLMLRNVNGETEEITAPAVKFKLKQGSVKVTASPKTALMYSGAYNSVEIDMNAVLKGADAPEIENVTLVGNTDAFTYEYNKEGNVTLTMNRTGRAVKGKSYSLQFRVSFAEQADNVKPVTVRCTVKVK